MNIDTQKSTKRQDASDLAQEKLTQVIAQSLKSGLIDMAGAESLGHNPPTDRTRQTWGILEGAARRLWVKTADNAWHDVAQGLYGLAHPEDPAAPVAHIAKAVKSVSPEEIGRVAGELIAHAALSLPEAQGATGIEITWGTNGPQDPTSETVSLAAISAAQALFDLTKDPVYGEVRRFLEE